MNGEHVSKFPCSLSAAAVLACLLTSSVASADDLKGLRLEGEKFAFQDHSETFDSRVYGHGGSVEPKFVTCPDARTDDLSQIVSPGQCVGGMNQGDAAEIAWLLKLNLLNQPRTAQRAQALRQ